MNNKIDDYNCNNTCPYYHPVTTTYTKLIFNLIQKSALPIFTITPGNIYVCIVSTNNYVYYYDANETSRIKSAKFKYEPNCASLEDLKLLPHSQSGIIYITSDGGFFIYDDIAKSWSSVEYLHEVSTLLGIYDTLMPATAYNYDVNGIKVNYAFKTVASAVYTSNGDTVENAIRQISKSHIITAEVICTADGQTEFVIPYPEPFTKETFLPQGNSFIIFIGSTLVDMRRYTISEDNSKLIFTDGTFIKKDRNLVFIFIYNTTLTPQSTEIVVAIDGNDIVNNSIPTKKLALTTTSYNVNNPSVVATASSVYNAVQYLLNKLDTIDPNKIVYAMTTGSSEESKKTTYFINVPGWTLSDGAFLNLKLHAPMFNNALLSVNGGLAAPIYKDFDNPIKAVDVDTDAICLYYNAEQNRYYITSGLTRSLNHYNYVYTAPTDGIAYIDLLVTNPTTGKKELLFDFDPFIDNLTLYQDGIYLVDGVNYNYDIFNNRISFINYTLDKETQIIFDIQYVSQLRTNARQLKSKEILGSDWTIDTTSGDFLVKYKDIVALLLNHDTI